MNEIVFKHRRDVDICVQNILWLHWKHVFCKTVNKSQIDKTFGAYFSFILLFFLFQLFSQNVDRIDGKTLEINPIEEIQWNSDSKTTIDGTDDQKSNGFWFKKRFSDRWHKTLQKWCPFHWIDAEVERIEDFKTFECNECHKQFRRLSALGAHQSVHSNERPFVCDWSECE